MSSPAQTTQRPMRAPAIAGLFARANLRGGAGGSLMPVLAVVAFTAASWTVLTVAGGAWMFYRRGVSRGAGLSERFLALEQSGMILGFYVFLTVIACVFLLPAVYSLTARAAVLGATGREERLAVLRLLGVTAPRAAAVALVGTLAQAAVGIVLGTVLSLLTAPLWSALSFQFTPVGRTEILLPWPYYLAEAAALMALAAVAAVAGLRRVAITPLGVARREADAPLRSWRAWLLVVLVAVVVGFAAGLINPSGADQATLLRLIPLVFILNFVALHFAMAWVLQLFARLASRLPGVAHHTACRRIVAAPVRTWNGVSVLAYLSVLLGAVAVQPVDIAPSGPEDEALQLVGDVVVGGRLTVAFAFGLAAVAVLLERSAAVYRERRLDRSLILLGAPGNFLRKVAFLQVLEPLLVVVAVGFCLGAFGFGPALIAPFEAGAGADAANVAVTLLCLVAGLALVALAQAGSEALRSRVRVTTLHRRRE